MIFIFVEYSSSFSSKKLPKETKTFWVKAEKCEWIKVSAKLRHLRAKKTKKPKLDKKWKETKKFLSSSWMHYIKLLMNEISCFFF